MNNQNNTIKTLARMVRILATAHAETSDLERAYGDGESVNIEEALTIAKAFESDENIVWVTAKTFKTISQGSKIDIMLYDNHSNQVVTYCREMMDLDEAYNKQFNNTLELMNTIAKYTGYKAAVVCHVEGKRFACTDYTELWSD